MRCWTVGAGAYGCGMSSVGKRWSKAGVVCPSPGHGGSRVRFAGHHGPPGHRRQRYLCAPNASPGAFSGAECTRECTRRCVGGAQIALPTMPWRTVVPRETHPRPTVTRARTDHPRLAPALAHRRHAATVCTGTDSPTTHLRVHSAPENAPGDALGGAGYRSPVVDPTTKGVPMNSTRKTALVAGIFYLIAFVSIPTLGLY